jgi:hypothetical protein
MTSPDTSLERSGVDPEVTAMVHGLALDHADPPADAGSTSNHSDPFNRDQANGQGAANASTGERVYAPASERVPVAPVAGHRHLIDHPDTTTPERVAAGLISEPPFARVARPSAARGKASGGWAAVRPPRLFFGLGVSWVTVVSCSVGVWLFLRWRRERAKPINRIRRQARHTADVLRERVPAAVNTYSKNSPRTSFFP